MENKEKIKDGGQAFPLHILQYSTQGHIIPTATSHGMTLRDYFAGQALMGLLNNAESRIDSLSEETNGEIIANNCYYMADCMLAARERTEK